MFSKIILKNIYETRIWRKCRKSYEDKRWRAGYDIYEIYQTEYQLILLGDFALSAQTLTLDKRNWGEDCQKRMKF